MATLYQSSVDVGFRRIVLAVSFILLLLPFDLLEVSGSASRVRAELGIGIGIPNPHPGSSPLPHPPLSLFKLDKYPMELFYLDS